MKQGEHWRARLNRQAKRALGMFWMAIKCVAALFVLVTITPVVSWWATVLAGEWQAPGGDILIVLGGSVMDYGTIGGSSYWRAVYALQAWNQGRFREVVITGGGPQGSSGAEMIRDFLVCHGVPSQAILLETRAESTRENAVNVAHLLRSKPGRLVLLTSDYHVFRAQHAFRKVQLEVEPWPYPDVRKRATRFSARWPAFLDLLEESGKTLFYAARGWI